MSLASKKLGLPLPEAGRGYRFNFRKNFQPVFKERRADRCGLA